MWTAVPPAKSSAFRLLAIQPPTVEPSALENAKTQCATGKYTIVTHRPMNSVQPQNFARSAIAPEISAGVMIANISWNITNASTGVWWSGAPVSCPITPLSPMLPKLPSRPAPMSLPNARL